MEIYVLVNVGYDYYRFEALTMVSTDKNELIAHAKKFNTFGSEVTEYWPPCPIKEYDLDHVGEGKNEEAHWWIYTKKV